MVEVETEKKMTFDNKLIDSSWTLFLDRDGVLNHEKKDDYIRTKEEFIFYDGVLEAIKTLSEIFGIIVIITNQRGIGRGLMTHEDLDLIHKFMIHKINDAGGRIDKIYYAPDIHSEALDRKPNIGMGLKAKKDFQNIDFLKSVMIGNNISDMQFGKNLGMKTVYVETTNPLIEENIFVDYKAKNLEAFSLIIK